MKCSNCGSELQPGERICTFCGQSVEEKPAKKPENVVTGAVGALVGALIGGASIILISQLGYIASISGLILAVCTLKGYELLGSQLSKKGIIISLILVLITPYLADRIDWAIVIMNSYAEEGVTFAQAFAAVQLFLEEGAIEMADYVKNLLMIYGFVALGAFATLRNAFKK